MLLKELLEFDEMISTMLADSKLNKKMLDSFLSFYSIVKSRDIETENWPAVFI